MGAALAPVRSKNITIAGMCDPAFRCSGALTRIGIATPGGVLATCSISCACTIVSRRKKPGNDCAPVRGCSRDGGSRRGGGCGCWGAYLSPNLADVLPYACIEMCRLGGVGRHYGVTTGGDGEYAPASPPGGRTAYSPPGGRPACLLTCPFP